MGFGLKGFVALFAVYENELGLESMRFSRVYGVKGRDLSVHCLR